MSKSRRFTGANAEDWFRNFAKEVGILSKLECPVEFFVRLLERELPKRLENGRAYIYVDLPQGDEWISTILSGRIPSEFSEQDRQNLSEYLLDKVLGTDTLVEIRDNTNTLRKVAVDVTVDPKEEEEKLAKIQGRPEKKDRQNSDRNVNIPPARKILGIDKHLILVLNRDKKRLPSYSYLLNQLQEFVNNPANTKALNLLEVPEQERFNWSQPTILDSRQIWDKFIQGVPPQAKHLMSAEAAARAIQAGYDRSEVCGMLSHDPQYRQFMRRDENRAEEYAQRIYDLALEKIERENRRSLTPQPKQPIVKEEIATQSSVEPDSQKSQSTPERRSQPRIIPEKDNDIER